MDSNIAKKFNISVCVPAFNEEKSLRAAVEDLILSLSPYLRRLEIIIVDDGSTDATPETADCLCREYSQVKAVHHKYKSGIGRCYRDALAIASGEYFTWFPSDHEDRAEEFVRYLPYLDENTAVTVQHVGSDPRSLTRRVISRCYTWLVNKIFSLDLQYYNGLTMFPVSVLRSFGLIADGFFIHAEGLIRARRRGFKVVELSAPLKKRENGISRALSVSSLIQILKDAHRFNKSKLSVC